MTNQEAFTRMVQHLRHQGRQSVNEHGCCYRAPNGDRCAVGVLITDEFYTPKIEGCAVSDLLMQLVLKQALPNVSLDILTDMQNVHDVYHITGWEPSWQAIATHYGLTMPAVDDIPSTTTDLQGELVTCPSTK